MTMKKHRARQRKEGGEADTHLDSDDQKHLRNVVLEEIEAVMRKHQCGGVVLLNSVESAAWRLVLPDWGGLYWMPEGIRMRIRAKTAPAEADATMGFIRSMRDFSAQVFNRFDQLWATAEKALGPENIYNLVDYDMGSEGKPKPPEPGDTN